MEALIGHENVGTGSAVTGGGWIDDEAVLTLADCLPAAYRIGVVDGGIQPGDTVAIVGAGPIGLAAIMAARLFSPAHLIAIDLADARLGAAKQLGADVTLDPSQLDPLRAVNDLTSGLGVDVAIETVGLPETIEMCARLIRPGGHIATLDVHGRPATPHQEDLWTRKVTITTDLVDT